MNPRLPNSNPDGEEPVDAHLRTALRHAPDADAAPPAALSAAILSQARAAASIKQASTQAEPLAPVWQLLAWLRQGWLALSQPALAAGVASIMVASVVGVMWWDRVPEEMNTPREVSHDTALPPPVADETKSAAKPTPNAALQNPVRPEPVEGPSPSTPERRDSPLAQSLPKGQSERSEVVQRSPGPAAANTTAPIQPTSNAEPERRAVADAVPNDKEVALNAPTHRIEVPSATAPAALPESTAPRARADAPAPAPPPAPAPAPAVAAAPAPALKASPLERESARASGIALGFAASTPIASLREALRDEPERWAWQKNAAAVSRVVPELLGWLAQVESAAAGRSTSQFDFRASRATQVLLTLRWIGDGQTAHTLVLQADGLVWQSAGASAWFAPLDAATVKRLMDTLP